MRTISNHNLTNILHRPTSILPLVRFRVLFGLLMCFGTIRFMAMGWMPKLYLEPQHFFKFHGFEWVVPLGQQGMYFVFILLIISSLFIAIGLFSKLSTVLFLCLFCYVELIDATNYLNHHYLVALLAFLLIFLPANAKYSLDSHLFPRIKKDNVPAFCIYIIVTQFCLVYFFAGFAKLNPDWLFRAMPMSVWLPEHRHWPILGYFFQFKETAYLASWFGAAYDLSIWAFLLFRKTRWVAYGFVVIFHTFVGLLFNIGLFPYIMILGTLIFFKKNTIENTSKPKITKKNNLLISFFSIYLIIQIILPLRFLAYPSRILWAEEGYRFSWRVMLVEKSGSAIFTIKDPATGKQAEIINSDYLTTFQEKQMAIQPDFILQYAKIIAEDYEKRLGIEQPIVTADVFVALNGRPSQRFIDPQINLAETNDSFCPKKWILPFNK